MIERDLGDDARGEHVALEDVGIAAQRRDPFLNPRAARVVHADHRCADLHGVIHDLADLLGVRLGERAAEDREILAEDEHHPAVDRAVAGDHAVARHGLLVHAEVVAAVPLEHVPFLERIGVEQELDALAGGELALGVLRVDALLAAPQAGSAARFSSSWRMTSYMRHLGDIVIVTIRPWRRRRDTISDIVTRNCDSTAQTHWHRPGIPGAGEPRPPPSDLLPVATDG